MKKVLFIALAALAFVQCESEPKEAVETAQLNGKWELKEASRNGDPTTTLSDLYFNFSEDGTLDTNMPTMEGSSEYEVEGMEIEQEGNGFEQDYVIESLTEDELILTTNIQNYDFRMVFNKAME
ncbi:MAG: lipocalin family protein [Bacteroidota bacterium]